MDKLKNLETLYLHELKDLYDAEHQITDALPKMADKAGHDSLKSAFREHLEETRGQIRRLEQVFELLGEKPKRETCKAMKGLIAEGEEVVKANGDSDVIDAALIGAAQRVEHYEMAGYGTVRALARELGHQDQARLLQENLDEEKAADTKLNELAKSRVNREAVTA
jgi:ferritin-like metal-binding protein YciE